MRNLKSETKYMHDPRIHNHIKSCHNIKSAYTKQSSPQIKLSINIYLTIWQHFYNQEKDWNIWKKM